MLRLQAFKYELMLKGQQARLMRQLAGARRFVFNKALVLEKDRYERGEKKLGYAGLCKLLTEWRHSRETPWLADMPVHPLQQSLKDLERAYTNFFRKRTEFPRFKKKGRHDSFRYPDPNQIYLEQNNSRIFLPKLGWLRYRNSRAVLGEVSNVTVRRSGEKWFVSIQTEREVGKPVHSSDSIVGMDVGVVRFATLSNGTVIEPLNSLKNQIVHLARYQRSLARKQKFSKNWKKARARITKLHGRITNARRDFLHKVTTTISKNHAVVVIEDLKVADMSQSAKGTIERPGQNVKAKSRLNRLILDQGWYEGRRQLEYKQQWRGGLVIAVPPPNTSRACPCCSCVWQLNRKTQAEFVCVECGYTEHADLVGALNILAAGHAVLACGESVRSDRSEKQEPTEAAQAAVGISAL